MLEVCIDAVASARAATAGGADRVELCANLPEGGTTPSAGMIQSVRGAFAGGLMVLIRPRGYDFLYAEQEVQAMLHDIRVAHELGADGVVIGCLTPDGRVDARRCEQLMSATKSMDVTFHRAFDMTRHLGEALEDVIGLGIKRILTSGGQPDAWLGTSVIADLVRQSAGRAVIMPGGGVTEVNLSQIVQSTGAREIHLSARDAVRSSMLYRNEHCSMGAFSKEHEFEWREASAEKIRFARKALTDTLARR